MKDLRQNITQLKEMLSSWQVKKSFIRDLDLLSELMLKHEDLTVAQFCKKVDLALSNNKPAADLNSNNNSSINKEVVKEYANQFQNSELERGQYLDLLAEIKRDKRLRKLELVELSSKITGVSKKISRKEQAYKSIEEWIHRKFDTQRRLQSTSGVF